MKAVAVTGGIGSGKSVVCRILAGRGIPVYDSDSAAKKLYVRDESLLDSIEGALGCSIRLKDGSLDKAKLSSVIFTSQEKLSVLESIVHPAVLGDFLRWKTMQEVRLVEVRKSAADCSTLFYGKDPFVVIESAIILSKPEFLAQVSRVVLVDASLSTRLHRACERDGVTADKVIGRMAVQHIDVSKADAIIKNEGSLDELEKAVEDAFRCLSL
jgi:dephospho-CoA kinase